MPWAVWVLSPEGAHVLSLPEQGELCMGSGESGAGYLRGAGVAARHVVLSEDEDGGLRAQPLAPMLLNDVQLRGAASLRAGDELRLGETRLLVLQRQRALPNALRPRREYEAMREGALMAPGSASILFLRAPTGRSRPELLLGWQAALPPQAFWSELGPTTLEVLLPGAHRAERDELAEKLSALGCEAVQGATRPDDGGELAELLEAAFNRFLGTGGDGPEELVDPVVLRLLAAVERNADPPQGWVVRGEPGSGKQVLARLAHLRLAPTDPFVAVRLAQEPSALEEAARAAGDGTLYVDAGESVDLGPFQTALAGAKHWFWGTRHSPRDAQWVLPLPALRERPRDVLLLAEGLLARLCRAAQRPVLSLAPSAREALQRYSFPGNARELRNAMAAAVLASAGREVALESLPVAIAHAAGIRAPENLRSTLQETEREALLATLARTRWNVTRAAQALGIPRRTVVYRMARLGLRRPERT
jgi:hypothetical protein